MKKTVTIREIFFYLFFAIMFGMRMWGIYESKPLYGPLLVLGFAFWGISMLMNEHTLAEYLVCAIFMIIAGLVYIKTGEKGLLLYFALMLGMKGIKAKKLFKVGIVVGMAGMITLTFLSAFGFIEDVAYVQYRSHVGEVFRRSLGFSHPNTLSSSFTILVMMIMYVIGYKDKVKVWKASIILLVASLYLYLYSGSRTGIAITVGYLFLNLLYAYRTKLSIVEKVFVALLMPFMWVISIVLPAVLSRDTILVLAKKDPTFAARWAIGEYYLNYNTVSLFGCRLVNPESKIYGIDMSQLYLFLQLGLVAFVIVSLLWIALLHDEVKNNRVSELVVTVSMLFMGITDPFLYNIGFKNFAFVFMGIWLYGFLEKNHNRLPSILQNSMTLLKVGYKTMLLPTAEFKICNKFPKKSIYIGGVAIVMIFAFAVIQYIVTPNPDLILADREPGEHILGEGMIGKAYTSDEITKFKSEGNMVLNYTDEQEIMFIHYTDEMKTIENGYYTPNAGVMEKLRMSISEVFWGTWMVVLILYGVNNSGIVKINRN